MARRETYEFQLPIEPGHMQQFARAIGDDGADYLTKGIAPLTFTMASDHFDPSRVSTADAEQTSQRTFHAEQTFTYHRHPRAGEVLRVVSRPGGTWEKQGRRSGCLRFVERIFDYLDADGDLAVSARYVVCIAEKGEQ